MSAVDHLVATTLFQWKPHQEQMTDSDADQVSEKCSERRRPREVAQFDVAEDKSGGIYLTQFRSIVRCTMSILKMMSRKPRNPPGPKPELSKIEGNWKDAVKKVLRVKRPAGGWPRPKEEV